MIHYHNVLYTELSLFSLTLPYFFYGNTRVREDSHRANVPGLPGESLAVRSYSREANAMCVAVDWP